MPIISFIDPHFDFETSIFVLGEIEELISKKKGRARSFCTTVDK